MNLSGKRVLVTGASSGIGKAIARMAASRGAIIAAHGRDAVRLKDLVQSLPGEGHRAYCRDLSETESGLERWVDDIVADGGPLSGFVHSAGYGKVEPLKIVKPAELDRIWRVNVAAAIILAKSFRKPANHSPNASIVLMASVAGLKGRPGQIAYAATKGAIIALTRSMALELVRDGVRVNAIAPAMVETELFLEMKRVNSAETIDRINAEHPSGVGQPDDVASMTCFLLSDEAGWITGATMPVDGGYSAA